MSEARGGSAREARVRAIVAGEGRTREEEDALVARVAAADAETVFASAAGSARHAQVLRKASDAAWEEYIAYVATETPTPMIGHEPKVAKVKVSREAFAIYDAARHSNMIALRGEALIAFFEAEPGEAAAQAAHAVRQLTRADAVSGLRRAARGGPSPLD